MALLLLVAISILAWRANMSLIASLRLRFENLDLLDQARRQTELAEQANLAKSRFLAAASHDFRQPVHALGMFVSALRGRAVDDEGRRLIEHIDGSVHSLDSLFGALLDISRLDAGIVPCRPEPFAIRPLLMRLCLDHAADAQSKGIRLVPAALLPGCAERPCAARAHYAQPCLQRRALHGSRTRHRRLPANV